MGLTVAEKNHWKERIERKLNRAIDVLLASNDPTFKARIEKEAWERAVESLGIAEAYNRTCDLETTIESLQKERHGLFQELESKIVPSSETSRGYSAESRVESFIQERQAICEEELMNASPLGQKIQKLKREQEELLDTVWIATSPVQIAKLWSRVVVLLGDSLTDLQQETLQSLTATQAESE